MPNVNSAYYGNIEVDDAAIIEFDRGIPGFEDHRRFALLPVQGNEFFFLLQSLHDPDICFTLADPEPFFPDYQPSLEPEDIKRVEAGPEDDIYVYVILTIPPDFKKTTANLMSPILVNPRTRKGVQAVPSRSHYTTRHRLFPEKPARAADGGK